MVTVYLLVEGGGDGKEQHVELRKGFRSFLERAGLSGHMPRIVACGGRRSAYDDFCTAIGQGHPAVLLVDSEGPVAGASPWEHLRRRPGDGWSRPAGAADADCHLMVQCMENWFLADRNAVAAYFGPEFRAGRLPAPQRLVDDVPKDRAFQTLVAASKDCSPKGAYDKGRHSFALLGKIDPRKVTAASPWAERFVAELKNKMGS